MERRRYSLYPRKRSAGKPILYCRFRRPDGSWGPGLSTGCTSENAARAWAEAKIETGTVPAAPGDCPTLSQWAVGFFGAGGRYDVAKRARGRTLSPTYLYSCGRTVTAYVLPFFGRRRLSEIAPLELETFFLNLYGSGRYSGSSVNNLLKAVRMLFAEAERLGLIRDNPVKRVGRFADNGRERGALSQRELDKLFAFDALATAWKGRRIPYLTAMLAAGCGLRHGEAVALRPCDIHGPILDVRRAWDRKVSAFRPPKWGSVREIPLPPRLQAELATYISENRVVPEHLLFHGPNSGRPVDPHPAVQALRDALEAIGIGRTEQARSNRFLDLHSLRHTYVTRLRAGDVPDWQLERAAGHRSAGMTRRYTHAKGEDLTAVAGARILPFPEERPA